MNDGTTRVIVNADADAKIDEVTSLRTYEGTVSGFVQLSLGEFQRLLEKVYEAQDN